MALIKCPECGKEISDASTACIHCGYPISKNPDVQKKVKSNIENKEKETPKSEAEEEKTKAGCIWIGFAAIILLFFAIGIMGEIDSSSASTKPKSYTPTYEYNIPDYEYDVPDDGLSGNIGAWGKGTLARTRLIVHMIFIVVLATRMEITLRDSGKSQKLDTNRPFDFWPHL